MGVQLIKDKNNPNIGLRYLIADIVSSSDMARDLPFESNSGKTGGQQAVMDIFKELIDLEECELERKARKAERKIPKDLPLRKAIEVLKTFFAEHVEMPFTAGKYYTEIGFKSDSLDAVELILKSIVPNISRRKIASIMQEMKD